MKHLTLLLLLLCPVLFYGQEDIFTESVTVEGFYKYEEKNSAFYEIYEGRILQPVYLEMKHSIELPDSFRNSCLVKIKGIRKRGMGMWKGSHHYNEQINVTNVLWAKSDVLLEEYLKEQSNKTKAVVNKPYESEGFLLFRYYDTIFYPKKGNVLYPGTDVIFKTKLSDKQKAIYNKNDTAAVFLCPLVKIKGYYSDRKDGEFSDKVAITQILSIDTHVNEHDFRRDNRNRKIENVEYFEEEGFYSKGMEHSAFTVLRGDSLVGGRGWVQFDKSVKAIDSLDEIMKSPDIKRGIYMKARGIRQSGGIYGYGHFGMSNYHLDVNEIKAIDTTRTLWDFMLDKIDRTGHFNGRKINHPDILKEGKEYLFEGKSHAYFDSAAIDKDTIYDIKINLTRQGGYLHYRYIVSYEGKILKDIKSKNIINVYALTAPPENREIEGFRDSYEALSPEMRFYDLSFFTIYVYNEPNKEGRIMIEIDDQTRYGYGATLYSKTD